MNEDKLAVLAKSIDHFYRKVGAWICFGLIVVWFFLRVRFPQIAGKLGLCELVNTMICK
ncbi:MAG: hypothetical protein ACLGQW_11410 [Acidobacteriota bacterium]